MHNYQTNTRMPQRVRNELRFRRITVVNKLFIAGAFWRITFEGSDLTGFTSPGFDDHIKVFFPDASSGPLRMPRITDAGIEWEGGSRPSARDYTPLEFDGKASLTLDFYIHDGGIASSWANQATPGDQLIVGGPRGSFIAPADYAFQLYVCDETGLPAFMRRKADVRAQNLHLFACADEGTGRDYLPDMTGVNVRWFGSGSMQADKLSLLTDELNNISLPQEDYFIWLTGEGAFVKALSDYFIYQRGRDASYVRAVAYWHAK